MFLTVSKLKERDKIRKVYDLNALRHFSYKNNFVVNLLMYKTGGSTLLGNVERLVKQVKNFDGCFVTQ
jgi:hypothetical protein